jgi:hypothetical protein
LPAIAARVDADREALAGRALEIALDRDPTMRTRHDELAIRKLFRDTITIVDRVVESIAADDVEPARSFGEAVPPVYRRRKVPMHAALDAANAVFKWHRRIAGDARKKNKFLQAIYKGA